MKAAMAGTLQVLVRIDGTERKEEATVACCFCNGRWTVAAQNWLAGTLCARRWRCGGSRARGEDELAVVSGLAMTMRCGEGDCREEDELAQVVLLRKWWLQVCAAQRDGRKRWRSKLGMECDAVVLRRRCGVVQIPARIGALEMEVEDGCCRGCWCVAGEVRRCGGGCHGGGRRKEN
ncbi:hypothetical protein DEO72_LG10g1736 [Vigna unguiculata]|uniref:Uncharacterized protein n=1 Tax=Vigna unguiculata TaxID=3917 RepID=A0A4D6N9T8_VIGUN|nr:hypothetical protein DEO72_LG10g1736 [Vigna unguiculata]